jgi:hypothetical protein
MRIRLGAAVWLSAMGLACEDSHGELGAPAPQQCPVACSMRPIAFRL